MSTILHSQLPPPAEEPESSVAALAALALQPKDTLTRQKDLAASGSALTRRLLMGLPALRLPPHCRADRTTELTAPRDSAPRLRLPRRLLAAVRHLFAIAANRPRMVLPAPAPSFAECAPVSCPRSVGAASLCGNY